MTDQTENIVDANNPAEINKIDPLLALYAIDCANDGITICDASAPDQPLIFVNKAFERMTGYSCSEVIGKNCRFLQNGKHEDLDALKTINDAIKNVKSCRVILKNYTRNGNLFWNELSLSPIKIVDNDKQYFIGIQKDVSAEVRQREKIKNISEHDDLTGLCNYRGFFNYATELIEKARQLNQHIGVGMIDLNDFKRINDTQGHLYGNHILRLLATELSSRFTQGDILSRLGGDEFFFASMIKDSDSSWFHKKITDTLNAVNATLSSELKLSVSVGFYAEQASQSTQLSQLIRNADQAMYLNKKEHHSK